MSGSDMQPLLNDGAVCFVRKGDAVEGLVLLMIDGVPVLRMMQRIPGNRLQLRTAAGIHALPIKVDEKSVQIIGRVAAKMDRV